jgi:hypothetical protein
MVWVKGWTRVGLDPCPLVCAWPDGQGVQVSIGRLRPHPYHHVLDLLEQLSSGSDLILLPARHLLVLKMSKELLLQVLAFGQGVQVSIGREFLGGRDIAPLDLEAQQGVLRQLIIPQLVHTTSSVCFASCSSTFVKIAVELEDGGREALEGCDIGNQTGPSRACCVWQVNRCC